MTRLNQKLGRAHAHCRLITSLAIVEFAAAAADSVTPHILLEGASKLSEHDADHLSMKSVCDSPLQTAHIF